MLNFVRIVVAIVILAVAVAGAYYISNLKKEVPSQTEKVVKTVFVDTVRNTNVPIIIPANGSLVAKNRLELYAEVQGVFRSSAHDFKAGQEYRRGETLLSLDSAEYYSTVQSAKSELYNLITSIMPDLRLDYPEIYPKWQVWLRNFDINKSTPPLPEITSERERYFITGRGVDAAYYNVKNLEQRLGKFRITAPFTGVLTESLVTKGTLIRPGQKLGEFIDPSVFELEVAIGKSYSDLLKIGEQVKLFNLNKTRDYTGEVVRLNARVDPGTQTVKVFIAVKGEDLKEGMYLEAELNAKQESNAIQIPRKLLIDNREVYVVRDSILDLMTVNPVYFSDKNVVLKGVPDGTLLLSRNVPGSYAGMRVKVYDGKPAPKSQVILSSDQN